MIHSQQQARIKPNMATEEYSNEQLNYFRLCHIITDEVAGSLRLFFKKEWNRLYKRTFGEWKDLPKNGWDFWDGESLNNRERHAEELAIMVNGNTAEWDCTKLFYAIRYSDCIGWFLKPDYVKALEKLRKARNKSYGHISLGQINDAKFKYIIKQIEDALQALGLSRNRIQMVCNQESFPTEELNNVLKKVEVLEAQLRKEISSFCVLPPKPSHEVADRDREVAEIAKQLKELKKANQNRLSYLYISGNPGSGKSQLAGLVAKRYSDVVNAIPNYTLFVMTVNAESPSTLLESYVSLARKLKCPEYAITNTLKSPHLKSEEKIAHMKSLIGTNVELYTTWLLVVDNVKSISKIHAYLPESGNEQWARGQLLITTQDSTSVPPMSPCVNHVSVSKGMEPHDAVHLLEKVSGISGCETEEVARKLDYQPLALARAAAYVREVRDIKGGANSGWSDYFEKLKEGRIVASNTFIIDPVYPKSMGEVTRLAVKEAIESTNVIIKYVFTLLFFCAPQPLNLEIVTNYIRNKAVKMDDEDAIRVKIQRCSLLLSHQKNNAFFIRIHQVVHDAIRAVLRDFLRADTLGAMKAAFKSFYQFVEDTQRDHFSFLDTFAKHSQCIPHLESLITQIKDIYSVEKTRNVVEIMFKSDVNELEKLGVLCQQHFAYQAAKECFNVVLNIRLKHLRPDDLDVGSTYSNLGNGQIDLQEHLEAKQSYILRKEFGPEDADVGMTYKNLGNVHQNLFEFIKAKGYYDLALPILRKKFGPEDANVGMTYRNLGDVHQGLSEFIKAKEYYDLALPILRKEFGPEDAYVGMTCRNLGDVHQELSEFIKAKEYYDLALLIFRKWFGPEDAIVGIMCSNLGEVHQNLSEFIKAKKYYDLALPILRKEFGPEDAIVGKMYGSLGEVHQNLSEFIKAKEYYDLALPILRKELGPENAIVGMTYGDLGDVHQNLSEFIKAKEYYDLALPILRIELGPENAIVGMTYRDLGDVHQDLSEFIKAKEYYDLALPILRKGFGPENAEVGMTYRKLGDVNQNLSEFIKAKVYYDLALPILRKAFGPESYVVVKTLMELGNVLRDLGELNLAKGSFDLALPILLKEFGPEHCLVKMIKESLVKIKQLQENSPRSSGSFGKRPNCSAHLGLVLAKRSKKM